MKRFLFVFLIALIGAFFLSVPAIAGPHSGLWVGTATLKYVSEVNKQYSDLSFDLGLAGVKAHDTLISGADWDYNSSGIGGPWPTSEQSPVELAYGSSTTVYLRNTFNVADPGEYEDLRIRLWRDGGVVLYLNNEEIFRNNLSPQASESDYALSEITDNTPVEFTLPASLLETDVNELIAEVHRAGAVDTDLIYDLELTANLEEQEPTELIAIESNGWKYNDTKMIIRGEIFRDQEDEVYKLTTEGGAEYIISSDSQDKILEYVGKWVTAEGDVLEDDGEKQLTISEVSEEDWHAGGYSDSGWTTGQGQFGYGENDENKTVSESAATIYFRKTFSGNSADFTHLRVLLLRDDGAVVYVNGTEILRSNMPSGTIEHGSAPVKALGSADENRYIVVDVDVPPLTGTDVLAVELHQHPAERGGSTGDGTPVLTRTSAPLDLRLLLHVDGDGAVKLLKEVIQMSKPNPQPGEDPYVLLTDHRLVSDYTGVAIRDGVPVGRRLSAVGFDFDGLYVNCNTGFSQNGIVNCDPITLIPEHPTNPFLHRYHPDHDNWDERYENTVVEAYEVTREIALDFDDRYPPDEDLPVRAVEPAGWGFDLVGGYYEETLEGLYRHEIKVRGPFILRRVVTTDTLTP
jgi:hypothetical protein